MEKQSNQDFEEVKENELIAAAKAARILGVSPKTVRKWADDGYLPFFITVGNHKRYRSKDIQEFLRCNHVKKEWD